MSTRPDVSLPAHHEPSAPRLATARSIALVGLDGQQVEVEAMIATGIPRTTLVGLPDTAVYEARDRCRAAVAASGLTWPRTALTINLTPASLPKAGSHHDLAIAAAVLAAAGTVPVAALRRTVLLGELGLDGRVRAVRGLLPAVLAARGAGHRSVLVPAGQEAEAALVEGVRVCGVATLAELVSHLQGRPLRRLEAVPPPTEPQGPVDAPDFADVIGQQQARWAAEVAAAGRHHLLLSGPPGVGKTLIASRMVGILPDMDVGEALETAAVRSLLGERIDALDRRPPYAAPHHSCSMAAMVGGGQRIARPGAVSRAHGGLLFLDEAPEFSPVVLDALRTPLEAGEVILSRSHGDARYPARFQLVLAMNPCPCGQSGVVGAQCRCTPMAVRRYRGRISGPLQDRIDIRVQLGPPPSAHLALGVRPLPVDSSAVIAARVLEARARQHHRLADTPWTTNAETSGAYLRAHLPRSAALDPIETATRLGELSTRGVDRALRLSWTLADLAGHDVPDHDDVRMALALRRGDPFTVPGGRR